MMDIEEIDVTGCGMCGDTPDRQWEVHPVVLRAYDHVKFQLEEPLSWRADGFWLDLSFKTTGDIEIPVGEYCLDKKQTGRLTVSCGEGVDAVLDVEILDDGPDEHSDLSPMVFVQLVHVTIALDRYRALCEEVEQNRRLAIRIKGLDD